MNATLASGGMLGNARGFDARFTRRSSAEPFCARPVT